MMPSEFNSAEGGFDPDDSDQPATEAAANQSLVPSSLGFTFCLDGDVESLELEVCWGRYERGDSATEISEKTGKPTKAWKRVPSGSNRMRSTICCGVCLASRVPSFTQCCTPIRAYSRRR